MLTKHQARSLVVLIVISITTAQEECPVKKRECECEFSSDADEGGEGLAAQAATKSEALAAAAGAMSPLLIGGAGFGIYKLIKGRSESNSSLEGSVSDMSDEEDTSSIPPKYSSRHGSGMNDDVSMNEPPPFANTKANRSWGSNDTDVPFSSTIPNTGLGSRGTDAGKTSQKSLEPVGNINAWMSF